MKNSCWIQTYTGRKFYPLNPAAEDICWVDIAHALSNICRFTGHCSEFYSVAQHCVIASQIVTPKNKLWALLHDASEAYICDVSSPIKKDDCFKPYREIEKNIMDVVMDACELSREQPDEISKIDLLLLRTEGRDLKMYSNDWSCANIQPMKEKIVPWSPKKAEKEFQKAFDFLYYFRGKK